MAGGYTYSLYGYYFNLNHAQFATCNSCSFPNSHLQLDKMQWTLLTKAVFLSVLLCHLPVSNAAKQSSKPNIVFIVADDLVSHIYERFAIYAPELQSSFDQHHGYIRLWLLKHLIGCRQSRKTVRVIIKKQVSVQTQDNQFRLESWSIMGVVRGVLGCLWPPLCLTKRHFGWWPVTLE